MNSNAKVIKKKNSDKKLLKDSRSYIKLVSKIPEIEKEDSLSDVVYNPGLPDGTLPFI